jgi:TPR repeat protein
MTKRWYRAAPAGLTVAVCASCGPSVADPPRTLPTDAPEVAAKSVPAEPAAAARACEKEKQRCEEACNRSDMTSCARFGRHLEEGDTTPHDVASGCANLGWHYLKGIGGVAPDRTRGIELLRRGCNAGFAWGCDKLKESGVK